MPDTKRQCAGEETSQHLQGGSGADRGWLGLTPEGSRDSLNLTPESDVVQMLGFWDFQWEEARVDGQPGAGG